METGEKSEKRKGGRRPLTRELYDRLLEAYRDRPGAHQLAATAAGCHIQTARRLWSKTSTQYPWAEPIKLVLEREAAEYQKAKRAAERAMLDKELAEREARRTALREAQKADEQIMQLARANVTAALAISAELLPAMRTLNKAVNAAMQPDPATGYVPTFQPKAALQMLEQHSRITQRAALAARLVAETSATMREAGKPVEQVTADGTRVPTLTEAEALAELHEATMLLEAHRATEVQDGELVEDEPAAKN